MWEFFEDRVDEIIGVCGFIALITGIVTLAEVIANGWQPWAVFFVFSVVLTIFYCVGVFAVYAYRSYVFDEYHFRIPVGLFSSFILVITTSHVLVSFYAISGILFSIALLFVVLIISVVLFAVWHKNQIESKEG